MITWLPAAFLALSFIILIWDVVLAGRIAQLRQASRPFSFVTGMCGLFLLPAVLLRVATSTFITGRAVVAVDWIWPLVLILFSVQSAYAVWRRLVNYLWGLPILVYNLVITAAELVRYGIAHGSPVGNALAGVIAAQTSTLAVVIQSPIAVTTPFFFLVPLISPAFPALRRTTAAFRAFVALTAFLWVVFIAVLGSSAALQSRRALADHTDDRVRERPLGDFRVGIKILPDIGSKPSSAAVEKDLDLLKTLQVRAIALVFTPGVDSLTVDSVARIVDRLDDSLMVIAVVGYKGKLIPELGSVPLDEATRLATVGRIVRRVHPSIILPAEDPLAEGSRIVGRLPAERWQSYYTAAARAAKAADPHVRVGLSISSYGSVDSTLYAWAARRDSPIDVIGFSLFPDKTGLRDIVESFEPAADRWMKTTPPVKEHWVFATGGFPLNFGELTQERIVWHTISWATDHPAIKGLIVYEASDYAQARGLRAPNDRLRRAVSAVMRAVKGLRESITG